MRDGVMAEPLQSSEAHHREQRAHVKTRRCRIEPDVSRDSLAVERFAQAVGDLRNQTAPLELSVEVHVV